MNKKWLIGCGGCLVFIIIIVVGLLGLLFISAGPLFDRVQNRLEAALAETSEEAIQEIFGEHAPDDYKSVVGVKSLEGEGFSMVIMKNINSGNLLMGSEGPLDQDDLDAFRAGDSENLAPIITKTLSAGSQNESTGDITLLSVDVLHTTQGRIQALRLAQTGSQSKTRPVFMTLIPLNNNRVKTLILMKDANLPASPDNSTFDEDFKVMTVEMTAIIDETDIMVATKKEDVL